MNRKLICTLDGTRYYLGPTAPGRLSWQQAHDWIATLGPGYALPPREVMLRLALTLKPEVCGFYWTVASKDKDYAWGQQWHAKYTDTSQTDTSKLRQHRAVAVIAEIE